MPGMDGYEIARKVRQGQHATVTLVAITGCGGPRKLTSFPGKPYRTSSRQLVSSVSDVSLEQDACGDSLTGVSRATGAPCEIKFSRGRTN
jgi:CheY-like chemotaxis protein